MIVWMLLAISLNITDRRIESILNEQLQTRSPQKVCFSHSGEMFCSVTVGVSLIFTSMWQNKANNCPEPCGPDEIKYTISKNSTRRPGNTRWAFLAHCNPLRTLYTGNSRVGNLFLEDCNLTLRLVYGHSAHGFCFLRKFSLIANVCFSFCRNSLFLAALCI